MTTHIIYDPIHGQIELNEHEFELISLPVYQRLQHLKQLGFSVLEYPSAVCSRFEHSLGVMHNSRKMAESLEKNGSIRFSEKEKQIIRLAAMLHDVGHGPFSHFFERILREFKQEAHHEAESIKKIKTDLGLKEVFKAAGVTADDVALLVDPDVKDKVEQRGGNWPIMARIISGDIDADRMDYLVRDTFFTGFVPHVDLDFLINALISKEITVGNKRFSDIFVTSQGVVAADTLLFARFLMRQHVWLNRMNRAAELLIYKAVKYAREVSGGIFAEEMEMNRLFSEGNDEDLLNELNNVGGFASQVVANVYEGNLFANYEEINWGEINPYYRERLAKIDKLGKDKRIPELSKLSSEIEEYLKERLGLGQNEIFVDLPELGIMPEANQKVLLQDNSYELLGTYSPLAANLSRLYKEYYVAFVFVRNNVDEGEFRDAVRDALRRVDV